MLPMTRASGTTNMTIIKKNTICIQSEALTGWSEAVNRRTDNTMIKDEGQTAMFRKG
jgi:hypothetical protein